MRDVDRRSIELGIPGIVLMENAGQRVVEFMSRRFAPLHTHRIVVVCGKGNNGGDGLVIARQIFTRFQPRFFDVILTFDPSEFTGDAAANLAMLRACGCSISRELGPMSPTATLVVDAVLGTGLHGPAKGPSLEMIRRINTGFPLAKVVAVDIPSGLGSDSGAVQGEFVRADFTITFTALKMAQAMPPACDLMGEVTVGPIGSPESILEGYRIGLVGPRDFRHLLAPRNKDSNKGLYGHVLVVAGSRGRTGAAAMCGTAALRAGAGLVTVATAASALPLIAGFTPELMTDPLLETESGAIEDQPIDIGRKTIVALGPGMGTEPPTVALIRRMFRDVSVPMVVDADALNALAGPDWKAGPHLRVLTPHPGEMARLADSTVAAVQSDRLGCARKLASEREIVLVLKGERTLIAFPDGRVWINPTGSPAMATGGSGDILTGLVAGMLGQFPKEPDLAIAAAVYLHGLAGELGANATTEQTFLAMDLLKYLPEAIHASTNLSDQF
jgi:ADP-dependent NAD(P)H-hydrate dehydratase / NAD(P)H-hydrate epimerase